MVLPKVLTFKELMQIPTDATIGEYAPTPNTVSDVSERETYFSAPDDLKGVASPVLVSSTKTTGRPPIFRSPSSQFLRGWPTFQKIPKTSIEEEPNTK